ncbi:hypothetical protein EDB84DRAFT_1445245 [Lactarius hengduanensis]|nr:hypothetical protein EDB84DRAFT_1445245 [Lactarius hengduanensis]
MSSDHLGAPTSAGTQTHCRRLAALVLRPCHLDTAVIRTSTSPRRRCFDTAATLASTQQLSGHHDLAILSRPLPPPRLPCHDRYHYLDCHHAAAAATSTVPTQPRPNTTPSPPVTTSATSTGTPTPPRQPRDGTTYTDAVSLLSRVALHPSSHSRRNGPKAETEAATSSDHPATPPCLMLMRVHANPLPPSCGSCSKAQQLRCHLKTAAPAPIRTSMSPRRHCSTHLPPPPPPTQHLSSRHNVAISSRPLPLGIAQGFEYPCRVAGRVPRVRVRVASWQPCLYPYLQWGFGGREAEPESGAFATVRADAKANRRGQERDHERVKVGDERCDRNGEFEDKDSTWRKEARPAYGGWEASCERDWCRRRYMGMRGEGEGDVERGERREGVEIDGEDVSISSRGDHGARLLSCLEPPLTRTRSKAFIRDHISTNFEVHLTGTYQHNAPNLPDVTILWMLVPPPPAYPHPSTTTTGTRRTRQPKPNPVGYGYVGVRVRVALENPRVTPGNPYLPPPRPPHHNCHLDSANSAPPQHNATPTCHRLDCTATYLGDVNRHPDPTSTGTRWRHIPITRTTHLWQGCPNTCDDNNDDRQQ